MGIKNKLEEAFNSPKRYESLKRRLWSKIAIGKLNECWEWQATKNEHGYGHMNSGRKANFKAHRVAYAMFHGMISPDIDVLHKCDNPACCNPHHLFLGTHAENMKDCIDKGRHSKPPHSYGEKHHNTKFSKLDSMNIIQDTRTYAVIAKEYGVCTETIGRLKRGETWR